MSMIISIYSKSVFREFILPSVNNADHAIRLTRDVFHIREDICLKMEILDYVWSFKMDPSYRLMKEDRTYDGSSLKDGDVFQILNRHQDIIYMIVRSQESLFHAYRKYDISHLPEIRIGKGTDNDISYSYLNLVSKDHAVIRRQGKGFCIINHSRNGTYVNSESIKDQADLRFGDYINIMGLHMVFLGQILAVDVRDSMVKVRRDTMEAYTGDKWINASAISGRLHSPGKAIYHRYPRNYEMLHEEPVEIEEPPELPRDQEESLLMAVGPSLTMALPMLLGCLMMVYASSAEGGASSLYMYSGLVMALSSALVGVIWSLVNIRQKKKDLARKEKERFDAYSRYLVEKTDHIRQEYSDTEVMLKKRYPQAQECLTYDGKTGNLWNRNRSHDDLLVHRVGIGDIPFQIDINIPKQRFRIYEDELAKKPVFIKENYQTLYQVPVTLDFADHPLIGIVGGEGRKGAYHVAQVICAQLAANTCYTDVKIAVICREDQEEAKAALSFVRWLPHSWSEDRKTRFAALDSRDAPDVFYELTRTFREREEAAADHQGEKIPKPYYIVILSDPSLMEGEIFAKYALGTNPVWGLTTILLVDRYEELPNSCEYVLQNDGDFQGMYSITDRVDQRQAVKFDNLAEEDLDAFARRLSGLRVIELEEGGEIPANLTFFDMFGVNKPEDLPVAELWAKNRVYDNIRGQIGQKAGGAPCYLDVHEKYHGPHGLVAGTTGSGKSETLQTYILSLAVNYSPDDIGFFLIDYKGGGMANLFDGLPHMIGQISNLSGNQVKRAMISIKSENRRRQRIFNENGVNNINAYTRLFKNGDAADPIPHMFIVIDEFAELKREEPEFMKELISVAQVGRSLGVHLILATQKPSGTVDDNIWSNSKFRLCLRVQDRQDSNDMLHKPDAAYITQAGRCYLQVGNDEIYELFQSGYSGAVYDENMKDKVDDVARLIRTNGKVEYTGNPVKTAMKKREKGVSSGREEKTQLEAVKEYLARMAASLRYREPLKLWMPVLPDKIYLEEFEEYLAGRFDGHWKPIRGEWGLPVVIGRFDDPENQRQVPLIVDFARDGHIGVCGNIVTGKSTLFQTMYYGLITSYSPDLVNIYALDFSSKMAEAFVQAPHNGGVMYENDIEKIGKFFRMMENILEERKGLFRGGNYSQYVRVHGVTIPAVVIMVDNYAAFKEKTEERYEEIMIRLSREGVNYGIFLVVSGAGFGMNDISNRVGENLNTILCLGLSDRFAYGDLLHNMQIEVLPETGIRGRGLAYLGKKILEYQTALALPAENDYQRMEKIENECLTMSRAWTGKRARPIPEIPEKPVWSLFAELEDYEKMSRSADYLPIGYDQSNANVYGIPLRHTYCYMIWGGRRTGKSNLMKVCIQAALDKKSRVILLDSPEGVYKSYKDEEAIIYANDEQSVFKAFADLLPEFQRRNKMKREWLGMDMDEDEIFEAMSKEQPYFIFLAGMDWFTDMIYTAELDMKAFLENILEKGALHNIYFFSELALERRDMAAGYPIYDFFTSYHTGIHLGGKVSENPMLTFDYIPFMDQTKPAKAGIGQLPDSMDGQEDTRTVVIPLARR